MRRRTANLVIAPAIVLASGVAPNSVAWAVPPSLQPYQGKCAQSGGAAPGCSSNSSNSGNSGGSGSSSNTAVENPHRVALRREESGNSAFNTGRSALEDARAHKPAGHSDFDLPIRLFQKAIDKYTSALAAASGSQELRLQELIGRAQRALATAENDKANQLWREHHDDAAWRLYRTALSHNPASGVIRRNLAAFNSEWCAVNGQKRYVPTERVEKFSDDVAHAICAREYQEGQDHECDWAKVTPEQCFGW